MHRHAAHRNLLSHVLAAFRQRDTERTRGLDRILEKQLVEIAHAVEQERIRIVRLDLDELLHHRRGSGAALLACEIGHGKDVARTVRCIHQEIHDCSKKRDVTLSASIYRRQQQRG
jgi:hypothetical protein